EYHRRSVFCSRRRRHTISKRDWSSDVCSSDLPVTTTAKWIQPKGIALIFAEALPVFEQSKIANFFELKDIKEHSALRVSRTSLKIGRASCRERGWRCIGDGVCDGSGVRDGVQN